MIVLYSDYGHVEKREWYDHAYSCSYSACSNAAVCGALTGCVVGFKSLPEDLLQFPHRAWLDQQVDSFLNTIGLKD